MMYDAYTRARQLDRIDHSPGKILGDAHATSGLRFCVKRESQLDKYLEGTTSNHLMRLHR